MKAVFEIILGILVLAIMGGAGFFIAKLLLRDTAGAVRSREWRRFRASGGASALLSILPLALVATGFGFVIYFFGYRLPYLLGYSCLFILSVLWLIKGMRADAIREGKGVATKDFDAFLAPYRNDPAIVRDLYQVTLRKASFGRFFFNSPVHPQQSFYNVYGGEGQALILKDLEDLNLLSNYLKVEFPDILKQDSTLV